MLLWRSFIIWFSVCSFHFSLHSKRNEEVNGNSKRDKQTILFILPLELLWHQTIVLVSLKFKICIFPFTSSPFSVIWWCKIAVIVSGTVLLFQNFTWHLIQPQKSCHFLRQASCRSQNIPHGASQEPCPTLTLYACGHTWVRHSLHHYMEVEEDGTYLPPDFLRTLGVWLMKNTKKMAAYWVLRERQPAQAGLDETSRHCSLGLASPGRTALLCCQLSLLLLSRGAALCATVPGLEWKLPWWLTSVLYLKAASNKAFFKAFS